MQTSAVLAITPSDFPTAASFAKKLEGIYGNHENAEAGRDRPDWHCGRGQAQRIFFVYEQLNLIMLEVGNASLRRRNSWDAQSSQRDSLNDVEEGGWSDSTSNRELRTSRSRGLKRPLASRLTAKARKAHSESSGCVPWLQQDTLAALDSSNSGGPNCTFDACKLAPCFAYPREIPALCTSHRKPGMVDRVTTEIMSVQDTDSAAHNCPDVFVNIIIRPWHRLETKCAKCSKTAVFACSGHKAAFCGEHKAEGMLNAKTCPCAKEEICKSSLAICLICLAARMLNVCVSIDNRCVSARVNLRLVMYEQHAAAQGALYSLNTAKQLHSLRQVTKT
eukprot:4392-Heterococcus_DN1.PRE.5